MRVVVQRVAYALVEVEEVTISAISRGLLVLIGVAEGDTEAEARWLAHKVANLRIFPDAAGKMNLSLLAIDGSALVVSQFTLYGDVRRGFRPSFAHAAPPPLAERLVDRFVQFLREEGVREVETGQFGAHMRVELVNDGPVTIVLERAPRGEGG